MTIPTPLQPDQEPARWDRYAEAYERVFEPLTTAFLTQALDRLGPLAGLDVLDVAAGAGGGCRRAARRRAAPQLPECAAARARCSEQDQLLGEL